VNRRVLAALAVLALLTPAVAAVAPAAGQSASDLTLDELQQDGTHYSTESMRLDSSTPRIWWLEHEPPNNPMASVSKSTNGPKFASGDTLSSNRIFLRTQVAQEGGLTRTVKIASWQRGQRTVKSGNTTSTQPVAENVTVTTQQVQFDPIQGVAEVSIPQHDEAHEITMWVDSAPNEARWRFTHESVATTQPIPINTYSDFLLYGAGFIILPAVGMMGYGSKKIKNAVDRAGKGPGHGFAYYAIVSTILAGAVIGFAYVQLAEIIVTVPFVLGGYVALIGAGYTLATHEGKTESKLFWQPHIKDVTAFAESSLPTTGGDGDGGADKLSFSEDMPLGKMQDYTVLDEGQRGISVVRDGWLAFLARIKGGRAKIENAEELKTRFSLAQSEWDECFIVDPDADTLLDYEPPGLRLKTPDFEGYQDMLWPAAVVLGVGAGVYQLAQIYGVVAWAAVVVLLPVLVWWKAVEGTDSRCHIDPAPAATRAAYGTALTASTGLQKARDLEQAEDFAWRALASQEDAKLDQLRRGDDSIIGNAFEPSERTTGDGGGSPGIDGDADEFDDLSESEREEIDQVIDDDTDEAKGGTD
jgi:hypothetical protein